jgi:hypothetical protein
MAVRESGGLPESDRCCPSRPMFAGRSLLRESAGINRHGEGDENALHRRPSKSRWPRVMRWRPVRAQRSVDRGCAGGAIEPRNTNEFRVSTLFSMAEGHAAGGVSCESLVDPARSENPGTHDSQVGCSGVTGWARRQGCWRLMPGGAGSPPCCGARAGSRAGEPVGRSEAGVPGTDVEIGGGSPVPGP